MDTQKDRLFDLPQFRSGRAEISSGRYGDLDKRAVAGEGLAFAPRDLSGTPPGPRQLQNKPKVTPGGPPRGQE